MQRSYNSKKHPGGPRVEPGGERSLRGPRRTGPIRGVIPGDDVEVAREIARLWEWHYRLEAQYRRVANSATENPRIVDDTGRGGCYYENYLIREFDDDEKGRYWPLNEAADPMEDMSGTLDLEETGGVSLGVTGDPPEDGEDGISYATFDGTNDVLSSSSADTFMDFDGLTKFTVSAVIKPTTGFAGGMIAWRISGGQGWYFKLTSDRYLSFSRRGNTAQITTTDKVALNRWSHVVATFDGSTLCIYINGERVASHKDANSATGVASATFKIGGSGIAGDWFKGSICHVGVLVGSALGPKQIEMFSKCAGGTQSSANDMMWMDSWANIPTQTTQIGTNKREFPGTLLDDGWVPVCEIMPYYGVTQTDIVRVGVIFLEETSRDASGTPTYSTLGQTALTQVQGVYKVVVSQTPTAPAAKNTTCYAAIVVENPSALFVRSLASTIVKITWVKKDPATGNTPVPPKENILADGTVTGQTIEWDGATWVADLIENANVKAGAAIAYSKLNLATSIVNADIAAGAAIAYSKLNLATSIVNADIAAGAAIAYSKLSLGNSIVNADIAAGAAIAYSKLSLGNSIVNADIAAGAAIDASKIAVADAGNDFTATDVEGVLAEIQQDNETFDATQMQPSFIVGDYYSTWGLSIGTSSTAALADGTAHYTPFYVSRTITLDRLGVWLATNGTVGSVARMGIYNNSASNTPGTLVVDGGTVATDAGAAVLKTVTISQQLTRGWYWFCVAQQGGAATGAIISRKNQIIGLGPMSHIGTTPAAGLTAIDGYTATGITGALASTPTVTLARGSFLGIVAARIASVP